MSVCIADSVKQFCNSFVSLRMDLSNNNGPTLEYTTVGGTTGEDAKAWIANNIGLDISGWQSVYSRSEVSSSGNFNTVRYLDDHWIYANREYAGIVMSDGIVKNGSFFIPATEYYSLSGVSVGSSAARSPESFSITRDRLLGIYNYLNKGTHFINTSGQLEAKPSNMTAKQFIAEHNPSVPDPYIEFGEYFYGLNDIQQAIYERLSGKKTINLSSIFTQNGLFSDTGTIWDLIQLHAGWSGMIPVANSIWGIGAISSGSENYSVSVPENAISSYNESDALAGKGRSIVLINKKPGRYKRPKDGMDGKDADLIKETKKHYYRTSDVYRGDQGWGATGSVNLLNAMYGQDFDEDDFATAMLLKTNLFQTAKTVTKAIRNTSTEVDFDSQWEYLFPEIKDLGDDWQKFVLGSPMDVSGDDIDQDDLNESQNQLLIETLENVLPSGYNVDAADVFNKLYPQGMEGTNNNVEKAIGYWSEYNRFFGSWTAHDEYGHNKRLIPHGSASSDTDGNSTGDIQAINIFGSQSFNLGTKSWGVVGDVGSLSFIDATTPFQNSPFWRFQSMTSDPGDLTDEEEEAGSGNTLLYQLGRGINLGYITNSPVTGGREYVHLLCVDTGATVVPTFEDILSKHEQKTYLKIHQFDQNEYHATVEMDFYGAGAYKQELWQNCKEIWVRFRDWAAYQKGRSRSLKVFLNGEKEEDVTKVRDRTLESPDSSEEEQKESINPSVKNSRSYSANTTYACEHSLNMDYEEYTLNYAYTQSGNSVRLLESQGNWQTRNLVNFKSKCPPAGIYRSGFTLINELYEIDEELLKYLDSINFTVKGGTLHAEYSFGNSQIIPNYESLVGAKYALNRVIR